ISPADERSRHRAALVLHPTATPTMVRQADASVLDLRTCGGERRIVSSSWRCDKRCREASRLATIVSAAVTPGALERETWPETHLRRPARVPARGGRRVEPSVRGGARGRRKRYRRGESGRRAAIAHRFPHCAVARPACREARERQRPMWIDS